MKVFVRNITNKQRFTLQKHKDKFKGYQLKRSLKQTAKKKECKIEKSKNFFVVHMKNINQSNKEQVFSAGWASPNGEGVHRKFLSNELNSLKHRLPENPPKQSDRLDEFGRKRSQQYSKEKNAYYCLSLVYISISYVPRYAFSRCADWGWAIYKYYINIVI